MRRARELMRNFGVKVSTNGRNSWAPQWRESGVEEPFQFGPRPRTFMGINRTESALKWKVNDFILKLPILLSLLNATEG